MTESNPSTSNADEERLPTNAEDRKAAAALSSLNDNEISGADGSDADGRSSSRHFPSKADQEALGKAMSRLEIAAGGKSGSGSSGAGAGKSETAGSSGEEVKKKVVKVAAEDVALLVGEYFLILIFIFFLGGGGRGSGRLRGSVSIKLLLSSNSTILNSLGRTS